MRTHRHNTSKVPWQDDYLFASRALTEKVVSVKVMDEEPGLGSSATTARSSLHSIYERSHPILHDPDAEAAQGP